MTGRGERWRGLVNALTVDNKMARALAIADSRAVVRALFLGSAVRLGLIDLLEEPRDLDAIAAGLGATRRDRLAAWLAVGIELGELGASDGRYSIRGRRARALAAGDPVPARALPLRNGLPNQPLRRPKFVAAGSAK